MGSKTARKGLLERLRDGVVLGDGGMMTELERRGYCTAGNWTPQAIATHPSAVRELHREFARAGSDVLQAMNFFASPEKLASEGVPQTAEEINAAAVRIAREEAAAEGGDRLVCASLTSSPLYKKGATPEVITAALRGQLQAIMQLEPDFIMCEWVFDLPEMELIIATALESGLPVVACMSVGTRGDNDGVTPEQCAVRMARAGAHVVGTNCGVGPRNALRTVRRMRQALRAAGLERPLILQPICMRTTADGATFEDCGVWPCASEPLLLSRFDARAFARAAYEEGVRYIGGCCGFRPYHIRAMAEELAPERNGIYPPSSFGSKGWAEKIGLFTHPLVKQRCNSEYWMNVKLSAGELALASKSAKEYLEGWKDEDN